MRHEFTVAVDLDEVLGQFVEALCRFHNKLFGSNLSLDDFFSYDFMNVWGGTAEQSSEKVLQFFQSEDFQKIEPVPGSLQVLQNLKNSGCNLVVVTARQNIVEAETRRWLNEHFPDLFTQVLFGNHYSQTGKSIPKSELCLSVGAKVLIDDNVRYANQCAAVGIQTILFDWDGRYGWNKAETHESVIRAHSWSAVADMITAIRQNTSC
eukprot:ANDGO_02894.mRNA.1 Putative 5'(3')-deoxyribonucleotidase